MKLISTLILIGLLAPLLNVSAAQDSEFDVAGLSDSGRQAYAKLHNARLFAIGGVGFGAQITEGELALHVLLSERQATVALKRLIHTATPEGSLYALLGLHLNDIGAFIMEVENYREPPERNSSPLIRFTPKGEVVTARGCIFSHEPLKAIVSAIQAGEYDQEFRKTAVSRFRPPAKESMFRIRFIGDSRSNRY